MAFGGGDGGGDAGSERIKRAHFINNILFAHFMGIWFSIH